MGKHKGGTKFFLMRKGFKQTVIVRFGSSIFENHFGELIKLVQIGLVQNYLDSFEVTLSKTKGLTQDQLV